MKDILERIEESSHNESSHELLCRLHDCADEIQRLRAANAMQTPFQARVQPWMLECFGAEIAADSKERNHRFFEEAGELVQARGMTREEAHALVDYTWSRPIGESFQEVGGVMVTLAALCLAAGLDMHAASETELARITEPATMERIRAKQAAKPKHSPLPEHMDPPAECGVVPWQSVIEAIYAVDTESARRGEMYPQTADEQQEDRRAVKRVTEMIRWYATNGGAGIERFKGWPNLPPTSSPVALQEGRGAFEIWFKTEWNRYLDKPTLSEVKAKTWALKAWKAFCAARRAGAGRGWHQISTTI